MTRNSVTIATCFFLFLHIFSLTAGEYLVVLSRQLDEFKSAPELNRLPGAKLFLGVDYGEEDFANFLALLKQYSTGPQKYQVIKKYDKTPAIIQKYFIGALRLQNHQNALTLLISRFLASDSHLDKHEELIKRLTGISFELKISDYVSMGTISAQEMNNILDKIGLLFFNSYDSETQKKFKSLGEKIQEVYSRLQFPLVYEQRIATELIWLKNQNINEKKNPFGYHHIKNIKDQAAFYAQVARYAYLPDNFFAEKDWRNKISVDAYEVLIPLANSMKKYWEEFGNQKLPDTKQLAAFNQFLQNIIKTGVFDMGNYPKVTKQFSATMYTAYFDIFNSTLLDYLFFKKDPIISADVEKFSDIDAIDSLLKQIEKSINAQKILIVGSSVAQEIMDDPDNFLTLREDLSNALNIPKDCLDPTSEAFKKLTTEQKQALAPYIEVAKREPLGPN